jgi:predicted transcriptional regulator
LGGKQKKKMTGSGRPVKFKNLDEELASWVRECRSKNLRVSQRLIRQKAEKMFHSQDGDFKV